MATNHELTPLTGRLAEANAAYVKARKKFVPVFGNLEHLDIVQNIRKIETMIEEARAKSKDARGGVAVVERLIRAMEGMADRLNRL